MQPRRIRRRTAGRMTGQRYKPLSLFGSLPLRQYVVVAGHVTVHSVPPGFQFWLAFIRQAMVE